MELLFAYTDLQRVLLHLINQRVSIKAGIIGGTVFCLVFLVTVLWLNYRGKAKALKALTAKYNELGKKCSDYQKIASSMKHDAYKKNRMIEEQRTTISSLNIKLQEKSAINDECQGKVKTINKELTRATERNKQLNEEINELRQDVESFQKEKVDMQSKIGTLQREADAQAAKVSELTKRNQEINSLLQSKTEYSLRLKEEMQSKIETLQRKLADEFDKVTELTKTNQEMNTLLKSKTEECLQLKNKRPVEANNPIEQLL